MIPLSFAQQRLWFLDQLEPERRPTTCRSRCGCAALDVAALQRAVCDVVDRHEVLRTVFPAVGRRAGTSAILDEARPTLTRHDATAEPTVDAAAWPRRAEHAVRPARPRSRSARALFRSTATDHVLSLVLHHIAADGWSLGSR